MKSAVVDERRSTARSKSARGSAALRLRIEGLVAGGSGIAKLESGQTVFVPSTAPGDVIEAAVDARSRPAQGTLLSILEPSPERIRPECTYAERCGGCDWMHVTPRAQQSAHADIVTKALAHACAGASLPEIRVHPAPHPLAYRTRARFFASARRGQRVPHIGYRAPRSHELVSIDRCAVLDASLSGLLQQLPDLLEGAEGQGDISVSRGAERKPVVDVHWQGPLPAALWARIDQCVQSGAWAGARVWLKDALKPASFGDPRACIEGPDGLPLWIAPGGFAQPSDEGARLLALRVSALAVRRPGEPNDAERPGLHLLELFSGSGTLSVLLARGAASFTAVELDTEGVACARENFRIRGLSGKHTVADANAFAIPARAELIVLDPPRTGAIGVARAIAASSARIAVYASCDPATLARDVATLFSAGFRPTHIETLELFPQTSHVETIVRLEKTARRRAP